MTKGWWIIGQFLRSEKKKKRKYCTSKFENINLIHVEKKNNNVVWIIISSETSYVTGVMNHCLFEQEFIECNRDRSALSTRTFIEY